MSKAYTFKCKRIARSIITPCKIAIPFSDNTLSSQEVFALWDTGATCTCISKELAEALHLEPDDETELTVGDNRKVKSFSYSVQLTMGAFTVPYVHVNSLPASKTHDVIIGMDVITMGDLTISNHNGETILTFRTPSICQKDYERELAKYEKIHTQWLKVGNNLCPCGSKKQWASCHGRE